MAGHRRASWRVLFMDHQVCAEPHPTACLRYAGEVAANTDGSQQTQAGSSAMTFPVPRPRGTPAPAKQPRKFVRGGEYEKTTQAIFGKKRLPNIVIENAEVGRASTERRRAITRGGI